MDYPEDINLKGSMALYGFKKNTSRFFQTNDYREIRNFTIDAIPKKIIELPETKYISVPRMQQLGEQFITKHAKNVDFDVLYTTEENLRSMLYAKFPEWPEVKDVKKVVQFIKKNLETKNVFDIPVRAKVEEVDQNGEVGFEDFNEFADLQYYKALPTVVNYIALYGGIDQVSLNIYVHEIYHALSMRHKGYTENMLYNEFLSIFMELVCAKETSPKHMKNALYFRLSELKHDFLSYEDSFYVSMERGDPQASSMQNQTYILSTILAFDLFNRYQNGSELDKREIDHEVNKVLRGEQKLEKLIDKCEIKEKEGIKVLKKEMKQLVKN